MPRDDDLLFFHRWIFQKWMGEIPGIRFAMGPDWIGLDGKGEWMIGTDCEKLAKGVWRLIVLLLVQVLFEKMVLFRLASSLVFF